MSDLLDRVRALLSDRTRAYIYRVIAGTLPLLVVLGVIDVDVDAVLGFLAAVLAVVNTEV